MGYFLTEQVSITIVSGPILEAVEARTSSKDDMASAIRYMEEAIAYEFYGSGIYKEI